MPKEIDASTTMAKEGAQDRSDWQASPQPEDSIISPEHLALVDFAQRLGSVTTNDEPGIADAVDVKHDANLLMSLLSSPPHLVRDDLENNSLCDTTPSGTAVAAAAAAAVGDHHYMSDASTSSVSHATTASSSSHTQPRRDSFRFSHPSLSLDCKWKQRPLRTPCTAPDKTAAGEAEDTVVQPPAVLLGRALKVDDREAHRLSADAMGRNLLQSFQKAIKWRIQAWMDSLAELLAEQEKELKRQNLSQEEIRDMLMKTGEAKLYTRLRQAAQVIEVQHAETNFYVLPQRVQRDKPEQEEGVDSPLSKRRRIESEDSDDLRMHCDETEYQYSVCHAVEFDGTIHLNTPAGHSEITIEVPGFIEGTFLSSDPGMEDLTAVEVEIDTNILASMVEKSCRIIVRSSVEHICKLENEAKKDAPIVEEDTESAEVSLSLVNKEKITPEGSHSTAVTFSKSMAAVVTPKPRSSAFIGSDADSKHSFLHIPVDLDNVNREPRRISPQPRALDMTTNLFTSTPTTPSQPEGRPLPSMVSPAPKMMDVYEERTFKLAKRSDSRTKADAGEASNESGPNLPVLVEVACAARQAKTGLTGQ